MSDDILKQVRAEILKEDEKYLPWVPKHLDKTWEHQAGMAGAVAGAIAGALFGAHMGLAGPWGAIAGTVPCAVVGGLLGYFGAAEAGRQFQRDKPAFLETMQHKQLGRGGDTQVKQIQSDDKCSKCGLRKPLWWDKSNRCNVCFDNDNKKMEEAIEGNCPKCGSPKSFWWDSDKKECSVCTGNYREHAKKRAQQKAG